MCRACPSPIRATGLLSLCRIDFRRLLHGPCARRERRQVSGRGVVLITQWRADVRLAPARQARGRDGCIGLPMWASGSFTSYPTTRPMTHISEIAHNLDRFQITIVKARGPISHVCAAFNLEDAKLRIERAYPAQPFEVLAVNYLGAKRNRHGSAMY